MSVDNCCLQALLARRIKQVKQKVIEVAMGPMHTICITEETSSLPEHIYSA